MNRPLPLARSVTPPWFWIGLAGLWAIALSLRFWGLDRFNTLVFDEIYFAKFGHNYLTHTHFFDAHPPLGKYLIAVGIWLKGFNPWGYRWMNALTGSFIPVLVTGLAYQLSRRYSLALLAGLLAVGDGLLLVESRYALINVYLLAFGLLSQWLLLMGSQCKGWQRWAWLTLSGLSFGATVAVKWNGLGFLLGIYLFWIIAQVGRLGTKSQPASGSFPLADLSRLSPLQLFVYLPLVGAVLYRLIWIPHLQQNPEFDFWQVHQQMYGYHQRVGNGPTVHPYCSAWFSWPPMLRSVSYFYQVAATSQEPVPMVGPPMAFDQARYVYSVYAIGNPFLWWFASIIFLMVFGLALAQGWRWWQQRRTRSASPQGNPSLLRGSDAYIPLYLTTSYAANLLPWLSISRCAFLYHYMPAYLFSGLGLAWLLHRWLRHPLSVYRRLSLMILIVCMLSFLFWLPLYLGLPLSPREWQWRMWFPSWI